MYFKNKNKIKNRKLDANIPIRYPIFSPTYPIFKNRMISSILKTESDNLDMIFLNISKTNQHKYF